MLRAVCFDWFNTLAYARPTRESLWGRALADLGYEFDQRLIQRAILTADCEIKSPFGQTDPEARMRAFLVYPRHIFQLAGLDVPEDEPARALAAAAKYHTGQHFVLYDDVVPTLTSLKARGLILGLITNARGEMIAPYQELGLDAYLDFVATSEEAESDKPDPGIFELALHKANVAAAEAIHVGDQYEMDIVGALGAGMGAVLIDRYEMHPDIDFKPRITTLRDLEPLLD